MTLPAVLLAAIIIFFAWGIYAFPVILSLTSSALEACQSLLVLCVEYASIAKLFLIWSGLALISTGLVHASVSAFISISKARRAVARLPLKKRGSVAVIADERLKTAFTSGFLRPRIYVSTGLLKSLEKDELRAVFLHELKHKKGYDPLKFLAYAFLKDAFFYIPATKYLAGFARLKKEHEADDAASLKLGSPLPVASAMIKVARNGAAYGAAMAGEKGEVPGRVRRLIEGRVDAMKVPVKAALLSVAYSVALVIALAMPVYANGAHECTMEKCETHVNIVKDCKTHCSEKHGQHH